MLIELNPVVPVTEWDDLPQPRSFGVALAGFLAPFQRIHDLSDEEMLELLMREVYRRAGPVGVQG